MATYGVTERGQMKLFYRGYGYVKKYQKKCGAQVWKCTDRHCFSRVETTEGSDSVKITSKHTCGRRPAGDSGSGDDGLPESAEAPADSATTETRSQTAGGSIEEHTAPDDTQDATQRAKKKKAHDLELERHLINWINSYGDNQHLISRKMIQAEARKFCKQPDFKGSRTWLDAFLRRNRNAIGAKVHLPTKTASSLSKVGMPAPLQCVNCNQALRSTNESTEEIPSLDPDSFLESELGLTPNFTTKVKVKNALTSIYKLDHLEKMAATEGGSKTGPPRKNQPLCLRCATVLTDLYKLYLEFNLLRKSESYLGKQIKELDELVDNYARSYADLTTTNIDDIFKNRNFRGNSEDDDSGPCFEADYQGSHAHEAAPTFGLIEEATFTAASVFASEVEQDIKFNPDIPTDVSLYPELPPTENQELEDLTQVVLSPPMEFKDDPEDGQSSEDFRISNVLESVSASAESSSVRNSGSEVEMGRVTRSRRPRRISCADYTTFSGTSKRQRSIIDPGIPHNFSEPKMLDGSDGESDFKMEVQEDPLAISESDSIDAILPH